MKYFIVFMVLFSLLGCGSKTKYYTKKTVTASVTNQGEEKEVYRMTEIRELETKNWLKDKRE
jgi:predicted small lipoprotein YifL